MAIGEDNLFKGDKYKWSARLTIVNLLDKEALYNFLSTFSGTHYVTPRTLQRRLGCISRVYCSERNLSSGLAAIGKHLDPSPLNAAATGVRQIGGAVRGVNHVIKNNPSRTKRKLQVATITMICLVFAPMIAATNGADEYVVGTVSNISESVVTVKTAAGNSSRLASVRKQLTCVRSGLYGGAVSTAGTGS